MLTNTNQNIYNLLNESKKLSNNIKILTKKLDETNKLIYEILGNEEEVIDEETGEIIATYKNYNRTLFNYELFKHEQKKLYEEYCSTVNKRMFLNKFKEA